MLSAANAGSQRRLAAHRHAASQPRRVINGRRAGFDPEIGGVYGNGFGAGEDGEGVDPNPAGGDRAPLFARADQSERC